MLAETRQRFLASIIVSTVMNRGILARTSFSGIKNVEAN